MIRRVLATAAAVLLLAGCDDGSPAAPDPSPSASAGDTTSEATDDATSTAPVGQDEAVACPHDIVEPDPDLPDAVPEGATSVRLCAGGASGVNQVTPPVDALTTDVDTVVRAVNDQRLVDRPRCADLQLPTYQLAFGYPDGSRFVIAGRFTGCAELLVGSGRRAQAGPPLRAFVEHLVAQRSTATPPNQAVEPADLDCTQPREQRTFPLGDPTGLTVAVLCVGLPQRPERARRVAIPAEELTALAASMEADTGPVETFGCAYDPVVPWIVGINAWGDPITLTKECFGFLIADDLEWLPRAPERRIIKRLVKQAR